MEERISREYEASCWIDGIAESAVGEFCNAMQQAFAASVPVVVTLARAWKNAGLPNPIPTVLLPSSLVVRALRILAQTSSELQLLTLQVLSKWLLFAANPLPLAALILDSTPETKELPLFSGLLDYSRSLVLFDQHTSSQKLSLVETMLKAYFAENSYPLCLITGRDPSTLGPWSPVLNVQTFANRDCMVLTRELVHLSTIALDAKQFPFTDLLRQMLPVAISVSIC